MEQNPEHGAGRDPELEVVDKLPAIVARIKLGERLRWLRLGSGVQAEVAARHVGIARATLWRMENGDVRCRYKLGDIDRLTGLYQATAEAPLLTALAVAARKPSCFKGSGRPLPAMVEYYVELEAYASQVRWYSPQLVPDLLQTARYVRAAVGTRPQKTAIDLRGLLQTHPLRQRLLTRTVPTMARLVFVIDEAVLHRPVGGPDLMARQLRDILALAERPNVVVRVSPFDHRVPVGLHTGPFVILDFPATAPLSALGPAAFQGAGVPIDGEFIEELQVAFDQLYDQALDEEASRKLIDEAAVRFESG